MKKGLLLSSAIVLATLPYLAHAQEKETNVKYSWMLPKTVIDATITYTFVACEDSRGANLKVKITPTLVARTIPDSHIGRLAIKPADKLQSFWEDRGITLKTFAGSHILSSIGSTPTNQAGQITTNILTGLTKVVAVALGVPASPLSLNNTDGPPEKADSSKCGKAKESTALIESYKDKIADLQKQLANGVDEVTQKKQSSQVLAYQTLIASEQAKLDSKNTIVIKKTIDPGFTPSDVNASSAQPDLFAKSPLPEPHPVEANGLVAKIRPTPEELNAAAWYDDVTKLKPEEWERLEVNVYMDFPKAILSVPQRGGKFYQTSVSEADGEIFRDVAYIPVTVWRREKTATVDPSPLAAVQLLPPQMVAFGQYGRPQILPFKADTFKSLGWSMTFLENGEVTDAQFSNKARGIGMTGAFATAAGAANSIAAEYRSATSDSGHATALQGQADLIYQTQRLQLCQSQPANCPRN